MAFEVFGRERMWQHQRSLFKTERNLAILRDRRSGMSFTELAKKWSLSRMTIFNICRRAQQRLALGKPGEPRG